jgi:hypothetical protein
LSVSKVRHRGVRMTSTTIFNVYCYYGLNGKFLRFRKDGVSKPRSSYKAGIEKLVPRWEMVIASNGNYIID